MDYIGIDVHKAVSTVCVLDSKGELKNELVDIPTTVNGLQRLLEIADPLDCKILFENSTRSHFVYHFLKGSEYDVTVAHSTDLIAIGKSKLKTDRIDARKLAEYAMRMDLGEVQFSVCNITDRENMMMKSLCRLNLTLVRMRADMVRKVREYLSLQDIKMPAGYASVKSARAIKFLEGLEDPVLKNMMMTIRDLNDRVKQTENDIERITVTDGDMKILSTFPGMGLKSAAVVVSAIDGIGRFDSPRKLVSFLGADPVTRESASKRKKGHISKDGDTLTRYTLRNVVIVHVYRYRNTELSQFFHRIKGRMEHSKAVMATVRKLICIIWAMLTFREPFRPLPSK